MEDARACLLHSFVSDEDLDPPASPGVAAAAPILVRVPSSAALHPGGAIALIVAAVARRTSRSASLREALADFHRGDDSQTLAAITQRISRETDAICARLERLAKALVAAIRRTGTHLLIVDGADHIDSASIRLLARIGFRLRRAGVAVEVRFAQDPLAEAPGDSRGLIVAATWRSAAAQGLDFVLVGQNRAPLAAPPGLVGPGPQRLEEAQPRIAAALHLLAFDVALVLCERFAAEASDPDEAAEGLRIGATIFCNAAQIERAEDCLSRAEALARSPLMRSRILYTHALVAAKRRGAPDAARTMFEIGQRLIADNGLDRSEAGRLCLAWHDNGLALLDAMAVRASPAADRPTLLRSAARRERDAFQRIAADKGGGALYLRFNLRANCVMLFEMAGQPNSARSLFERSFAHFDQAAIEPRFRMTMQYRLGALAWKARDWTGAAAAFGAADAAARDAAAEQARNPIRLALAAAELQIGRWEPARRLIDAVIADARERLDRQSEDRGRILRATLREEPRSGEPPVAPGFVPSKLASYVPFIDLLDGGVGWNSRLSR